ncbi:hypothetical protein SEVIR_3G419000v4 [Setaria viridis]|uniref:DUF1618 domain-containing protein n=1 Tax=Setaria viridis TaxID=4556 RepID=A0A4U6VLS5_SETVI|nr:uncharacterized protein LOC117846824 [Setaria viridis]TKW29795.1 hypothetical protein SEVIR_3G419000v2 [Setaria viridis]
MDSDQESSSDDWVVLDSCTSSDDDDRVLALSSGCGTPSSGSATDSDSDADTTNIPNPILAAAAAIAATAAADDAEGVYALSDAEDDDAYPPPSPPLPKPLAGLFHHTLARSVSYVAFDPVPGAADAHHGAKQLVPDPTFSALISGDAGVAALASNRGLVCLRGAARGVYYVANPLTFTVARLPRPNLDHFAKGDPAVVITFDLDNRDDEEDEENAATAADDGRRFYRHYHVVVAFHLGDGIYAFDSFSSRTWGWTVGTGIVAAETVVSSSGVGALGCAFWRTTMGFFLCYEPVSGCADLVPAPMEVLQWPNWELGEMEGKLCATCIGERVSAVVILCLDFARRNSDGAVAWTLAGHFEGGCLWGRQGVMLLRSQGKAEVVMWDPSAEMVVAMDLEGRTTRTITFIPPGTGYCADFIPYVSTLAAVSASGNGSRAEPRTKSTNEAGAAYNAKSTNKAGDAETY